jgi:hypothetical protein
VVCSRFGSWASRPALEPFTEPPAGSEGLERAMGQNNRLSRIRRRRALKMKQRADELRTGRTKPAEKPAARALIKQAAKPTLKPAAKSAAKRVLQETTTRRRKRRRHSDDAVKTIRSEKRRMVSASKPESMPESMPRLQSRWTPAQPSRLVLSAVTGCPSAGLLSLMD